MSTLNYLTHISLTGSMKSMGRILDAVKKNLGVDKTIGRGIALPDLLDEECMKDPVLQEKKRHFDELGFKRFMLERRKKELTEKDLEDKDYLAYLEDTIGEEYSNRRMFEFISASETDAGFAIEFKLLEIENEPVYEDWLDWGDIARAYECTVFEDVELFRNGDFEDFCGTTVYEPEDGTVKETRIAPEHKLEDYAHEFNRLIDLNPERYRPLKIRLFETWICRMKNEVERERKAMK